MASVQTNALVNGLSGTLGQSIVFKNYKGNTIVTSKPRPAKTQSTQQKANRSKFRAASYWAKAMLRDADKKIYYQKKARKLNLPNAYTAAITDYMRNPKLVEFSNYDDTVTYNVSKKDFQLKKVEVILRKSDGEEEVRTITPRGNEWFFKLKKEEVSELSYVRVTDEAGREKVMMLIIDYRLKR